MGRYENSGTKKSNGAYKEAVKESLNKLPPNDSQLKHIFRNAEGHLPDTPENRSLVTAVSNNPECYMGVDKYGNSWYAKMQSDGTQIWVQLRKGIIQNAGKNATPHIWDSETGFSRNIKKKNTKK